MTELNYETFDLRAVISGINFPETTITVHFDESLGYQIYHLEKELHMAEIQDNKDELAQLNKDIENLKEKARASAFKITLRGLPESTRKACDAKARAKFPVEYSFLNQPVPNPERDDYYNTLLWASSITKVEDPQGRVALPTEEHILALRSSVGRTVVKAISEGISELIDGSKAGFEKAAQDVDFLSEA